MKKWVKDLVIPGIVSAVVSGAIGFWGNDWVDARSKSRGAQIEQVLKFVSGDADLLTASHEYIQALIDNSELKSVQQKLENEIAKQMREASRLTVFFKNSELSAQIMAYQVALKEFNSTIPDATDPTRMSSWVERLGIVLDRRRSLTAGLLRQTSVTS